MTKKVSHIILSFLLLVSTMGLTISSHYCGGELISVEVFTEAESCCDMTGGCCHNESETFQVKDDFTSTGFDFSFEQAYLTLPVLFVLFSIEAPENFQTVINNLPPLPPPPVQTVLARLQTYLL